MNPLMFILLQADAGGAAAEGGGGLFGLGEGGMSPMFLLVAMIIIFYFFMIRPQQKKQKEEQKFREGLSKGDKVVSIGGIHGTVEKVDEASVLVKVDGDTKLRFDKQALRGAPQATE
ncbi:preprotein translocase subunit YajC [Pontibacter sp. G13]|uniref:preprotein translocase subunit YajC n=1 Tax=Pontibacter sp. G13 TaxID=3074898 RepID=UPI00288C1758|nr:preprotein translocase subunit YajC [Pontibacter sp. G13]WNJ18035.1 preprotein translocase subunit YajC [Pontibacter sp. G13]